MCLTPRDWSNEATELWIGYELDEPSVRFIGITSKTWNKKEQCMIGVEICVFWAMVFP